MTSLINSVLADAQTEKTVGKMYQFLAGANLNLEMLEIPSIVSKML